MLNELVKKLAAFIGHLLINKQRCMQAIEARNATIADNAQKLRLLAGNITEDSDTEEILLRIGELAEVAEQQVLASRDHYNELEERHYQLDDEAKGLIASLSQNPATALLSQGLNIPAPAGPILDTPPTNSASE